MAQNTTIAVPARTWTLLTDSNVTAIRAQVRGYRTVELVGTVGATPPSDTTGSITLADYGILTSDLTLAVLFPGVSGANRVYAWCEQDAQVGVSHA